MASAAFIRSSITSSIRVAQPGGAVGLRNSSGAVRPCFRREVRPEPLEQPLLSSNIPAGNFLGNLTREVARMFLECRHQLRSFRLRELCERLWSVADTPAENVLVSYSDLRLILGVEVFNVQGRDLTLEAGYIFARDLSVNHTSVMAPDPTFLLQASMAF